MKDRKLPLEKGKLYCHTKTTGYIYGYKTKKAKAEEWQTRIKDTHPLLFLGPAEYTGDLDCWCYQFLCLSVRQVIWIPMSHRSPWTLREMADT